MSHSFDTEQQLENEQPHETSYRPKEDVPRDVTPLLLAHETSPTITDSERPRTRSQTGTTVKRRLADDVSPSSSRSGSSRKKSRAAFKKSLSPTNFGENQGGHNTESPPTTDSRDLSRVTTRSSSPYSSTPSLTFLDSSTSPGYAPERRGPRSRATLPVPVPNLTKKSRGRRVPTQESSEIQSDPKDKRMYICKVEGCGKCFHRGEHLKRHIRSIHTHEKPFMCTHPSCGKFFNRHDNLLQHLKVHRQNDREENGNPRPVLELSPPSLSLSPEPEPARGHEDDYPTSDSEVEPPLLASFKVPFPVTSGHYPPYMSSTRFERPCDSYTTNMAISSLRTELAPRSPPISRVRDSL